MKKHIGVSLLAISLAAPAMANAHITVQPDSVPAGSFARLDVRVPNERDDAATEKVEVQLPDGFIFVSYEPAPGWKVDVRNEKLDTPVESHGEQITEQVDTVTWTASDPSAAIQPGQFRDFGLSVGIPEDAAEGDVLTFPAIQTYEGGEVVRWIGDPEAESPAAQVTLSASEEEEGASSEEGAEEQESADDAEDDDGSDGLAIAALAVGAAGLGLGGIAFSRSRRS